MKLKHQLGLLIGIAVILMILVQFVYYFRFQYIIQSKANVYAINSINQVEENLNSTLTSIYKAAMAISYNGYSQEFLMEKTNETVNYDKRMELNKYITDMMRYILNSNENIQDIAFIDKYERIYTFNSGFRFNNYVTLKKKLNLDSDNFGRYVWAHNTDVITTLGVYPYSLVVPVFANDNNYEGDKRLGTLVVFCNTNVLRKITQKSLVSEGSKFIILDQDGIVVSSSKAELTGTRADPDIMKHTRSESSTYIGKYKGMESLIQYKTVKETGWKVISIIPVSELTSDLKSVAGFTFVIGLFMLILLCFIGIIFIRSITKPVSEIVRTTKIIGTENVKQRINVTSDNEVGVIGRDINKMLDAIEEMTKKIFRNQTELYEMQLAKTHAEFVALKSQINPHFLYNTLDSIRSLGFAYDIPEIVQISSAMANIFRYSIKGKEYVKIREEIECIEDYVSIMNIRFSGKFTTNIDISEELLDMKTIKMVLQPIVENAIYHGLEQILGPGLLTIRGEVRGETIQITVTDNGKGLGKEEMEALILRMDQQNDIQTNMTDEKRSIGISNIHRRIKLYFGECYGLRIFSREKEGTQVVVELPAIRELPVVEPVRSLAEFSPK
jgi:two-component system, sensor histidine kinase YesM